MDASQLRSSRCSHPVRTALTLALAVAATTLAGCQRRLAEPELGAYRAVLELPGGEVPFGLTVARENNAYTLYLMNGSERIIGLVW